MQYAVTVTLYINAETPDQAMQCAYQTMADEFEDFDPPTNTHEPDDMPELAGWSYGPVLVDVAPYRHQIGA